jgi:hypothetical protein
MKLLAPFTLKTLCQQYCVVLIQRHHGGQKTGLPSSCRSKDAEFFQSLLVAVAPKERSNIARLMVRNLDQASIVSGRSEILATPPAFAQVIKLYRDTKAAAGPHWRLIQANIKKLLKWATIAARTKEERAARV